MEMAPLDYGHGNGASSPGIALLWRRFQSDEIAKAVKFILTEGFGKAVSNLPLSGNILQSDIPGGDLFAHIVVLDVNVFSTCMELGVLRQCHCTLVIAIDHHCLSGLVAGVELIQKTTQPYRFLGGLRLADIFGLTG